MSSNFWDSSALQQTKTVNRSFWFFRSSKYLVALVVLAAILFSKSHWSALKRFLSLYWAKNAFISRNCALTTFFFTFSDLPLDLSTFSPQRSLKLFNHLLNALVCSYISIVSILKFLSLRFNNIAIYFAFYIRLISYSVVQMLLQLFIFYRFESCRFENSAMSFSLNSILLKTVCTVVTLGNIWRLSFFLAQDAKAAADVSSRQRVRSENSVRSFMFCSVVSGM